MKILTIFIAVILVLLFGTTTALIMAIKKIIKAKQEIKLMKQRENAYQYYAKQEAKIDEKLNNEKNKIVTGNINELFNEHFNGVPNGNAKPKITDIVTPDRSKDSDD